MTDLLWLVASAALVLACAVVPGALVLRLLGADRLVMLGLAPALGAAGAGLGAVGAAALGVRWSLLPFLATMAVLALLAALARRAGLGLDTRDTERVDEAPAGLRVDPRAPLIAGVPHGRWWLAGAAVIALGPLAVAFGRADGVLERWDTLYHLTALRHIRATGDGSSLHLGTISNTEGRAVPYPAAFHDLARLMPGAPIPVLLNGATAVLAVVPWVLGIAILARVLWPQHRWGPFAAAVAALLAPATPVDEWLHLSAIPNLTGFSMLPGLLAAAVLLWRALLARTGDAAGRPVRTAVAAVAVLALGGLGLALLQPNCAVMALLLLAVLTATTALSETRGRRRMLLLLVPLALLVPVALLTWTPLSSMVTDFVGGLVVPWWQAIGEIALGLLTVWPMALGVVLAVLWWPGLVVSWRSPARWVSVAWLVVAVLYYDAAIDSTANLSILFYRGQDRISMPLTMLTCLLVVPGLAVLSRLLGTRRERRGRGPAAITVALVVIAVAIAGASIPSRLDHARMNAQLDYPGRGRFLQADELEQFARVEPHMDHDATLLASPFSGAAHLYALDGQTVRFPVAGMATTSEDRALLRAVGTASTDPAACRTLVDAGVRYVYVERLPYQYHVGYDLINRADPSLGTVLFSTSHSRLIEVDCDAG